MVLDTGESSLRIPLGMYIAGSGYDWAAPSLEDIRLEIDMDANTLTVESNGWRRTLYFDIVI